MNEEDVLLPRFQLARNRSCLLFGCSWSHDPSWTFRTTHLYLGLWVLTHRWFNRDA